MTISGHAPERQTSAPPGGERPVPDRTCDRSDCPAPAVRELTLAGQDFYFCNHHAAELEGLAEQPRAEQQEGARPRIPTAVS